jgi:hypothetical protein
VNEVHGQQIMQFSTDDLPLFHHAATRKRVCGYIRACVMKGATLPLIDLIKRALARFGLSRSERMIRYYVDAVRADLSVYVFKHRVGRSHVLFFRSRTRCRSTGTAPRRTTKNSPCNAYYKREPEGSERNARLAPGASRLRGFAWAVARLLEACHWDNCKVRYDSRHAFNFALRWLRAGRLFNDIRDAYDAALHQRHKDATDWDGNNGYNLTKWEPSSTVSLADSTLRSQTQATTWTDLLKGEA